MNEFEKASGALKVFYNFGEHNITDGFHSTDHNYGLNLYESFRLFKGNNLTIGMDHMNYGGMAENLLAMNGAGAVFADTVVTETGIYGFMQQTLKENFTLNAGIRLQHHSVYGNHPVPSAGFAWKFAGDATWKGNVSKGFRSPTIRELFLWGPNPKLSPESIINMETGISNTFYSGKLHAELTFFSIQGDNLIITVPMEGLLNAGEINNKGIEALVNARPVKNLGLQATYSYIHMENPVYATPEHHLYLSANYQPGKLQLNASLQRIVNLDNDPSPVVTNESYTLIKARAMYPITRNLRWYVSGENLLNEKYQVNRYYTMPGATVFTGININL